MKVRDIMKEGWYEDDRDPPSPEDDRKITAITPSHRASLIHQYGMLGDRIRALVQHPDIEVLQDTGRDNIWVKQYLDQNPDTTVITWRSFGEEGQIFVPNDQQETIRRLTKLTKKYFEVMVKLHGVGFDP